MTHRNWNLRNAFAASPQSERLFGFCLQRNLAE